MELRWSLVSSCPRDQPQAGRPGPAHTHRKDYSHRTAPSKSPKASIRRQGVAGQKLTVCWGETEGACPLTRWLRWLHSGPIQPVHHRPDCCTEAAAKKSGSEKSLSSPRDLGWEASWQDRSQAQGSCPSPG